MIIKDGRFGAYVTDGELNATLRRGDEIETITAGARGGAAGREARQGPGAEASGAAKSPAKKAPAKKAAASTTAEEGRRQAPAAKKAAAKAG